MRNRFFSSTFSSFLFGKPPSHVKRVYPQQPIFTFTKFDPAQYQAPDCFRNYHDEIDRSLRTLVKEMSSTHMSVTLRTTLAHYHPMHVHHPAQSTDIKKTVREYGSVVFYTLALAKEGLEIISGENAGNPEIPDRLSKQHFDAIVSIPALQHLVAHPTMKACAERIVANGEDIPFPAKEPYEKIAPTRLLRHW